MDQANGGKSKIPTLFIRSKQAGAKLTDKAKAEIKIVETSASTSPISNHRQYLFNKKQPTTQQRSSDIKSSSSSSCSSSSFCTLSPSSTISVKNPQNQGLILKKKSKLYK